MHSPALDGLPQRTASGSSTMPPRQSLELLNRGQQLLQAGETARKEEREEKLGRGPYEATWANPGSLLNLNGKVKVSVHVHPQTDSATDQPPGTKASVLCRHLAFSFAKADKKSELMQQFSSPEGVAEEFQGKLNEIHVNYKSSIRDADEKAKHLVTSNYLGGYLCDLGQALEKAHRCGKPAQATCLLETYNHSMAIHMELKNKGETNYVTVKLYDPNVTTNYLRVEKKAPEDLKSLRLEELLVGGEVLLGQMGYKPGLEPELDASGGLPMMAVCLTKDLELPTDRPNRQAIPAHMHVAMQNSACDEMAAMLSQADSNALPRDKRDALLNALLEAKAPKTGVPGAYYIFQDGHQLAMDAFLDAVLNSSLSSKQKAELLAPKNVHGTPGLSVSLYHGQSEKVKTFAEAVLNSNLESDQKVKLLASKAANEAPPGLFISLENGRGETVKTFAEAVLNSNLGPRQKEELLATKSANGVPGVFMLLQKGNSETVKIFAETVLNSNLEPERKAALLAAKNANGVPGLFMSLQKGHTETVKTFTDAVLKSNLEPNKKEELLAAKTADGRSGLPFANTMGHSETVDAFRQSVQASDLPDEAKKRLCLTQ